MKKTLFLTLFLALFLIVGCGQKAINQTPPSPEATIPADREGATTTLVGNDRDEHGCIGSAGYSWCEAKQRCLRIWEESCAGNIGSSSCALENCHGLDIKCGPNPPDVCTEMYGIGDRCLQYAECGVQNGRCQQIQNSEFTRCKLCVQRCLDANQDDNIKLFECENKCN